MAAVLEAHAKLTLSLRVTGVRDDGYHLIDAEMVTLALHDRVRIDAGASGLSITGPYAHGVPTDSSNLVNRALLLCGAEASVHVEKNIPNGGGLGGGSADAAAVLRWAGWTDPVRAVVIGADVAFCLVGGRARVTGIGELIAPLPPIERAFTLVVPPLHCSTPAIYRRWDLLGGPLGDHGNDLEPAAIAEVPELASWRDRIVQYSGQRPRLAGSGSTWFLDGEHPDLQAKMPEATVVVTHTVA
ncbi:MAG: 4-diphosphocytidyl-2-C-methyl-D-erythritol kinase [Actinomycetota bacterium]|jgi:4-diphosphocytidyl-2-C-methyl-D-erythritol kinase